MSEPTWKTVLNNELLQEIGFQLTDSEDKTSDQGYKTIATAPLPEYKFAELQVSSTDDKLYLAFNAEPTWLRLPIDPTADALRETFRHYVTPALEHPSPIAGLGAVESMQYLREAQGRVGLDADAVTYSRVIGIGEYEESMIEIENAFTLCPYLSPAIIRQATANQGIYSQWTSAFSGSLVTISRVRVNIVGEELGRTYLLCEVQYYPTNHTEITSKLLEEHAGDLSTLPSDFPLDVIGMFEYAQFHQLIGAEELTEYVQQGSEGDVLPLALLTSQDDFERIFLPLATHEKEAVRIEVAMQAAFNKNETVYETAAKKGLPIEVKDQVHQKWPELTM